MPAWRREGSAGSINTHHPVCTGGFGSSPATATPPGPPPQPSLPPYPARLLAQPGIPDRPGTAGHQAGCRQPRSSRSSGTHTHQWPAMDRLENLCKVLGSNYQEKLDELGIAAGQEEIDDEISKEMELTISRLERAKARRFSKLQALGLKLRDLWKFHSTTPENILEFAEIFPCIDAETANELTNEKSLSMEFISKVTEEIEILEASMVAKQKKIYLDKKKKLLKLIEETHMVPSDMKFDPKKQVESDFPKAISDLKILIKQAKVQIVQRKDIVMRIGLLQHAVNNSLSVKTSERLLRSLKNLVLLEETFLFDGKDVKVVINDIEAEMKPASAKAALPLKKRISARLSELRDKKEFTAELPSPPYPSRVRDGNRERKKGVWGKETKR